MHFAVEMGTISTTVLKKETHKMRQIPLKPQIALISVERITDVTLSEGVNPLECFYLKVLKRKF